MMKVTLKSQAVTEGVLAKTFKLKELDNHRNVYIKRSKLKVLREEVKAWNKEKSAEDTSHFSK